MTRLRSIAFAAALASAVSCTPPAGAPATGAPAPEGARTAATANVRSSLTLKSGAPAVPEAPVADSPRRTPVVRAVQKASPSVVNISSERLVRTVYNDEMMSVRQEMLDQFFRGFFNQDDRTPRMKRTHSLGSGVIIDENGYILTNYHVIDRAETVTVMLNDGETHYARFVAGDEVNDLALIKIDVPAGRKLTPAEFADDYDLLLGEPVIAMGNPYGLSHTVSVGVLSATNREATWRGQVLYRDILQTDAAVNPGSSGGPLLNVEGKLIGVNVAIFQDAQNIGFAVPVRRARALLGRWMSPQITRNLWLGMDMIWQAGRIVVTYVEPGGAAEAAGIRTGTIIDAIAGHPANDLFAVNRELLTLGEGHSVSVSWTLAGESHSSNLKLVAVPASDANRLAQDRLGLTFKMHATDIAPIRLQSCLPVDGIRPGGPAARAGLTPGRHVMRINETTIRSLDDVAVALAAVKSGEPVLLTLVDFTEQESQILAHLSAVQIVAD